MNLQTPKGGDRVRVVHISDGDTDAEIYLGETGTVRHACPPEYYVDLDAGGTNFEFYDGELEVLEEAK